MMNSILKRDYFASSIIPVNYKFRKYPCLGKLKKFIEDLHSGKLHREFHYGADPEESTPGGGRPLAKFLQINGAQISMLPNQPNSLKVATNC
jgi:hypothetical protein